MASVSAGMPFPRRTFQNEIHRIWEVGCGRICIRVVFADKNRPHAHPPSGSYVGVPVSHDETARQIEIVFFGQIQDHARFRFSAAASGLRFVRAVTDLVDHRPVPRQLPDHFGMNLPQIILRHVSESDAALIGDDKYAVPRIAQSFYCLSDAGKQNQIGRPVYGPRVVVNHPVPIEKNRFFFFFRNGESPFVAESLLCVSH